MDLQMENFYLQNWRTNGLEKYVIEATVIKEKKMKNQGWVFQISDESYRVWSKNGVYI